MASTKIERTLGTPTNIDKWTYSVWVKRASIGADTAIVTARTGTSGPYLNLIFQGNHQLRIYGTDSGGLNDFNYQTTRLFRDTSAFYHIVIGFDNTLAAAGDRCKIYVNGVQETSFAGQDDPASGVSYVFNTSGYTTVIGARTDGSEYYNGVMSHINFVDGTQLTPSSFGETDATDGMWKIKTSPSVTYGNNGFFLKMEDSSNLDLDSSGNSISFTTTGTLTATKDNPDNNFSTLNPLDRRVGGTAPTFINGNNTWTASSDSSSNGGTRGTLGSSSGKYYFEAKATTASMLCCGMQLDSIATRWNANGSVSNETGFYGIEADGTKKVAGASTSSVFTALSNNDIIGLAFDLDNNKFWASVNGTWVASGNPTTGANSLGTLASGTYLPAVSSVGWSTASSAQFNFGNGVFGTTSVSSAGTNASNNGIFEYDVPTGFTALCTKGINT